MDFLKMSNFSCSRAKRVTDPLDDQAKARLVGTQLSYTSSGSEHSSAESPCLSELVQDFLNDDPENNNNTTSSSPPGGYESDSDRVDSFCRCTDSIDDIIRSTMAVNDSDSYRNVILAHALKASEVYACLRSERGALRRKTMSFMRELGHNAAICKTKWDAASIGVTAGNYEFIDVVQSNPSTRWRLPQQQLQSRYIVDLDFAAQFEIARPTAEYLRLCQALPRVFVGKAEDLKRIVKAMADAAKRSLKKEGLLVPPWRKNRYMQNKWLGPYKRTTSPVPANALATGIGNGVKCRCVGFDDGVNGGVGGLFVRTR